MELSRLALGLILISVLSFARAQVDCPPFSVSELGGTGGLVGGALAAGSGDQSRPASVQVHNSNIVCLRNGRTRDTYSGVSVVVNYTCTGGSRPECTGNPILSQFEFECVTGPTWAPSVGGSASNIITTPPNGNLSTTLRTDCGVCISPARSGFDTITNNEQHCGYCEVCVSPARSGFASITNNEHHCGPCNSACSTTQPSFMRCFNRLDSGCCDFFENDMCVANCTSPLVPNSNFDCVVDCGSVPDPGNGRAVYNSQGVNRTLLNATVTYTCDTGYTLVGNIMRTCQASGNWTGSDPNCNIVDCGPLMNPLNGAVDISQGTTFNAMATYSCNSPYTLNGGMTRTCQADGTWTGSAPGCELECQNGGTFNAGTGMCECPTGFTGINCSELECQNGGTFNAGTGMCECPTGFTGIDCSGMVCHPQCQNGGTCDTSSGTCQCPAGYNGGDCSVIICDPLCLNGRCVDGRCMNCSTGLFGRNCTGVCSDEFDRCVECTTGIGRVDCIRCEDGTTLDPNSNQCQQQPGGCSPGCIAGAIIGALLGALLLAAIAAAIIYALYQHFSTPATQLKKGDTEGLNGVAKDNPLYVDPTTVEEQVGEDAAAAVGDA